MVVVFALGTFFAGVRPPPPPLPSSRDSPAQVAVYIDVEIVR